MATARDYKSLPAAGGGLSLSSSTSAWGYGSYETFTEGLSTKVVLTHITIQPHIDTGPATDTTHELVIEIAKGADDTLVAQIPLAWRIDSRVAHAQPRVLTLPEPIVIPANTRIRGRVADSQAAARTHEGIKLFYYEEIPTTKTHTLDSLLYKKLTLTHTIDSLLFTSATSTHTLDSFLATACEVLVDSYSESNVDDFGALEYRIEIDSATDEEGQSFTGADGAIDRVKFYLKKTGAPTGDVVVRLYAHTGTFGASGSKPTGSPLATSDPIDVSSLPVDFSLVEFTFTGPEQYVMTEGTKYFVVLYWEPEGGTIQIGTDASSPSHAGWGVQRINGLYTDYPHDHAFYVYRHCPLLTEEITHTLDSLLKRTDTNTHTVDSFLKKRQPVTHSVDSLLLKSQSVTHSIDSLLKARLTLVHTLDSLLRKKESNSHSLDSLLKEVESVTHSIDSLLLKKQSSTHSIDSLLKSRSTVTHSLDSLLRKKQTTTHSLDSLLKEIKSVGHNIDSLLKALRTVSHSLDSLLKVSQTNSHTIDSLLRAVETKNHSIDSFLKSKTAKIHSVDSLLKKVFVQTHTLDSLLRPRITATHSVDSLLLKIQAETHSVDSLLQKEGLIKFSLGHSIQSYIYRPPRPIKNIYGTVKDVKPSVTIKEVGLWVNVKDVQPNVSIKEMKPTVKVRVRRIYIKIK